MADLLQIPDMALASEDYPYVHAKLIIAKGPQGLTAMLPDSPDTEGLHLDNLKYETDDPYNPSSNPNAEDKVHAMATLSRMNNMYYELLSSQKMW